MITTREIEALGFEFNDKGSTWEEWLIEFETCTLSVNFYHNGKTVELRIYQLGYTTHIELKGEVTIERIKNLIKALQ